MKTKSKDKATDVAQTKVNEIKAKSKTKKVKSNGILKFQSVENLRHEYSQDERNDLAGQLTRSLQNVAALEDHLKAVGSDIKAQITTAKSMVKELTNKMCNGYEMRAKEVSIELNRKTGKKRISHYIPGDKKLHGKLITETPMTPADWERLPLDLPPEKIIVKDSHGKDAAEITLSGKDLASGAGAELQPPSAEELQRTMNENTLAGAKPEDELKSEDVPH